MGTILVEQPWLSSIYQMVLDSLNVDSLRHGKRTLRDHLIGTASILSAWNESVDTIALGLFHSIYSTPFYRQEAASAESRPLLSELLGEELESNIFAFSMLSMDDVVRGLASSKGSTILCHPETASKRQAGVHPTDIFLPRSQAEDFLLVHIANLLEQDQASGGLPGIHLSKCGDAARLLEDRAPYLKEHVVGDLGLHQEMHLRDLYEEALSYIPRDRTRAAELLNVAIGLAPFLPELRAAIAVITEDHETRNVLAIESSARFARRGVTWDKRLTLDAWIRVAEGRSSFIENIRTPPADADANPLPYRFYQYLSRISHEGPGKLNSGWYPGLTSIPIHDSQSIPLSRKLEDKFKVIQNEVQALSDDEFHSEAEQIKRSGRWEVLILFEAGKKNVENCRRLPELTAILEESGDARTSAGLIYLSRLRPHTQVSAHRGGTNSRLRLHLGIRIPEGDCGMRVDNKTLSWEAGKTIVFDDFYEHEVWNNTDQERLILLVDIWHPELTDQERICLDAISKQISSQAVSRSRYWEANRKQKMREERERSQQAIASDPHEQLILEKLPSLVI